MLYTSAPNRQTSESTMRDSHVLRAWSVCRKEQQGGKGGGGTQKRCLAGQSSMVGFLHVQFVYLNSFHFNYEGIPFNIWWLLVLPMLVLVMVLLLLLLSQRVVSCPSPLLSCTVLLQLLNVARHARSLSRCRWQHDISTSPSLAPLPLRPWHITCILFRFHFVWQVNILTINWIRVFINCCVLHFIHTHTHTYVACGNMATWPTLATCSHQGRS